MLKALDIIDAHLQCSSRAKCAVQLKSEVRRALATQESQHFASIPVTFTAIFLVTIITAHHHVAIAAKDRTLQVALWVNFDANFVKGRSYLFVCDALSQGYFFNQYIFHFFVKLNACKLHDGK
jgi:hypothetical protein